jgi:hypothetical protein
MEVDVVGASPQRRVAHLLAATERAGRVAVRFVAPGNRANPYKLGTTSPTLDGWRLTVNSATINADTEVEAVLDQWGQPLNGPPPAGAQYTLVNLSATYVGDGSSILNEFLDGGPVETEGAHHTVYTAPSCYPPSPKLGWDTPDPVYSGQTDTGNLCFKIASNDATTLLLNAGSFVNPRAHVAWFALQ